MRMNKNNSKGFTLVELLVVIAIIGILAVVAVPSLFKQIDKSRASKIEANYSSIKSAVQVLYTEYGTLDIADLDSVTPGNQSLNGLSANKTTDSISTYLEIEGLEVGEQIYTISIDDANTARLTVNGLTQNVANILYNSGNGRSSIPVEDTVDSVAQGTYNVTFNLMN